MRGAYLPAVDVDRVGQSFKGVKRDPDGKDEVEMQRGNAQPQRTRSGPCAVQKEIEILEEPEYPQIDETTGQQQPFSFPLFFGPLQPEPDGEIGYGRDG